MREIVLRAEDLSLTFGGLRAVDKVNFFVKEQQIVGLIGPNGAGKTSIFNLLTGVYTPTQGDIFLDDKSIIHHKPYQINRMGIARTFQNIRLFKDMSVMDNVKTAMGQQINYSLFSAVIRGKSYREQEKEITEQAIGLLQIMGLEDKANDLARNLPYGAQRKLEITRALASGPRVLLLDEPAAGMNPTETQELLEAIQVAQKEFGLSVLLIEHDMNFVMEICEYIFVLDYGHLIAEGKAELVRNDPKVISAYLGGD